MMPNVTYCVSKTTNINDRIGVTVFEWHTEMPDILFFLISRYVTI